ncbi:glutathione S-transferase N-terminal domain-containing protein [bacterium]|nr:glutathione S-transferase N-terminal domain-containing protein [bacterium]
MKEVLIYTVDYCPFCKKAEMLLNQKNVKYKKVNITENEKEYRQKLSQYYDIKGKVTVPQIIIDGRRIGGSDDLERLSLSGELDKLLKD